MAIQLPNDYLSRVRAIQQQRKTCRDRFTETVAAWTKSFNNNAWSEDQRAFLVSFHNDFAEMGAWLAKVEELLTAVVDANKP